MPASPPAPRARASRPVGSPAPPSTEPRSSRRAARMPVPTVRPSTDRPERANSGMCTILTHRRSRCAAPPGEGSLGECLSVRVVHGEQWTGDQARIPPVPPASTRSAPPPSTWPATPSPRWSPTDVGDHLGVVAEGDRVVTHFFECLLPGYRGWRWAVTVTRVAAQPAGHRLRDGAAARPGRAARARAGCPGRSGSSRVTSASATCCRTPPDDERLAPGYLLSDDPAVEETSWELGLGRPRVLSREGRAEAAQRWYDGDHGPQRADLRRRPGRRPLRHLRLLPAAGRFAAAGVRRLRQLLRPGRRPGGQRRPRLRRALRGAGRDRPSRRSTSSRRCTTTARSSRCR